MREQGRGCGGHLAAARRPAVPGARALTGLGSPSAGRGDTQSTLVLCGGGCQPRARGPARSPGDVASAQTTGEQKGPFSRRTPRELKPLCGEESLSCEQPCCLQSVSQSFLLEKPLGPKHDGGCAHLPLHGAHSQAGPPAPVWGGRDQPSVTKGARPSPAPSSSNQAQSQHQGACPTFL